MIDNDPLIDTASKVADGVDVDWAALEDQASNAERMDLEALRAIAGLASFHRQLFESVPDVAKVPPRGRTGMHGSDTPIYEVRSWGPLLVHEKLGAGSYGEVYRAWDTNLQRDVALKLLRRTGKGKDAVVREGQLLARINHPNVMGVYGAQTVGEQVGIWGELLNGKTLAQIIAHGGALGAEETLVVAEAVCRALAGAHKAGLLHRDVKAQNVMRVQGGRIVLTDFGLGRELGDQDEREVAGTPLYMAPELFVNASPSVQSDLYSLGVLMFYLVTATYPVTGETVDALRESHAQGIRARLQDLRPDLPRAFVHVVERALEPQPSARFKSAGAMHEALTAASGSIAPPPTDGAFGRRRLLVLALAAPVAAAGGALIGWSVGAGQRPTGPSGRLLALEPPPGTRFSDSSRASPAISPDGRHIAVAATNTVTGKIHLWLHSLETAQARLIPDSENALAPFWAPDSAMLGFFEPSGIIKRVNLDGVSLGRTLTGPEPRGAAWSGSGRLLYAKGQRSGLYVQALSTGTETLVIEPDRARGELAYMWPQFLPDGEQFIYFVLSNDPSVRGLYLASLTQPRGTRLAMTDASGITQGDFLVFVRGGNLVAQRFSPDTRAAIGAPATLARNVAVNYDWRSVVSGSSDGTVVYMPAAEDTELTWFRRDGTPGDTVGLPKARYRSPALSMDGRLLAVQRYRDGLSEIQVMDLATGKMRPPLVHSASVEFPVWGPGHLLAYTSMDRGAADLYIRDFSRDDGSRPLPLERPEMANADKMPTSWSPDGQHLLVTVLPKDGTYSVWAVPVSSASASFRLRPGEGTQVSGRVSPNGQKALYMRRVPPSRDGDPPERELWTCDFPTGERPSLVATGAVDPSWISDTEVSFFDRAGRLTVLRLAGRAGRPTWIETGVNTPEAARNNYHWAPDGTRVLVNRPGQGVDEIRVMVLLNASHRFSDVAQKTSIQGEK